MTKYTYEFYGSFDLPNGGTRNNVTLGKTELAQNEIPSSGDTRKHYLMATANSHFAGVIAKNGTLTNVSIKQRGRVSSNESSNNSSGGGVKIGRIFLGLFLITFVYTGFYLWDSLKVAYYHAPIRAWNWFRNFIAS